MLPLYVVYVQVFVPLVGPQVLEVLATHAVQFERVALQIGVDVGTGVGAGVAAFLQHCIYIEPQLSDAGVSPALHEL